MTTQNDFGYFSAIVAVDIIFLSIVILSLSKRGIASPGVKDTGNKISLREVKKNCFYCALVAVPFVLAASSNFAAKRPAWTVFIPLSMALFLAADFVINKILYNSAFYSLFVLLNGLVFMAAGNGMVLYAFSAGTAPGLVTLIALIAAGWAGFFSYHSHFFFHPVEHKEWKI